MKAEKGDKIRLTKDVSYGSIYGLIKLPKGRELTVLERMESSDGIKTVEQFEFNGRFYKDAFPYTILDKYYEVV